MNYLVISINSTMIVKLPGPHPGLVYILRNIINHDSWRVQQTHEKR
jgi:hypothetical protein